MIDWMNIVVEPTRILAGGRKHRALRVQSSERPEERWAGWPGLLARLEGVELPPLVRVCEEDS